MPGNGHWPVLAGDFVVYGRKIGRQEFEGR